MLWLSALIIAIVSNLDNLAVGVAFGVRGTRIDTVANLVIAALTMAGTAAAMTSGHALSILIFPTVASWLGPLIIICIGGGTIVASLSGAWASTVPRVSHARDASGATSAISLREALLLGVALSLNNVGSGVGAGVAGIPPLWTTVLAGLCSLLCVGGGALVGRSMGHLILQRRGPLVAGVLLLAAGVAMLP